MPTDDRDFAARLDKGMDAKGKYSSPRSYSRGLRDEDDPKNLPASRTDVRQPKNVPGKEYARALTAAKGDWGSLGTIDGDKPPVKGSFKKGGKVKSTGLYRLHKGERVLTKKQSRKRVRGK